MSFPFTKIAECPTRMPRDLAFRPGWRDWSEGWTTRLWFHATDVDEPFSIFCKTEEASIGFHAGHLSAALYRHADIYRHVAVEERHLQGFVLPLIIRHRNAFCMPDAYDWRIDKVTDCLLDAGLLSELEEEAILQMPDPLAVFAVLERSGYDAIIYPNMCEGSKGEESILVWRAENIRLAHAQSFEEGSPCLCPSLIPQDWELSRWRDDADDIHDWKIQLLPDNLWELLDHERLPIAA